MAAKDNSQIEAACLPLIPSAAPKDLLSISDHTSQRTQSTSAETLHSISLPYQTEQSISSGSELSSQELLSNPLFVEEPLEVQAPRYPKPKGRSWNATRFRSAPLPRAGVVDDISMADIVEVIKLVAPHAEVACLCDAPEPTIENLKNLMEVATTDALKNAGTAFLLVEGSELCCRGLVRFLESNLSVGVVIPVLMEKFSVTNRAALCKKIATLVQNGADDVVVLPATVTDLQMTISISLAKGTAHRRVASNLEVKLRNATKQCDQLFWQTAHEILPDFPEEQTAVIEIPGQRVGNLVLVGKLGEGSFGEVHKCQNMETGEFSAVKVLPKRNVKSRCQLQQIAMEYSVLRRVSHPNVVSGSEFLHGVKNLYLIMELAGSTTLYKTIRAEGDKGLLWARAQKLLFQIASGVAHLHEAFAHCDLKPENISICKDGSVKIVDFGQAADVTLEVPVLERPRGTMPFIAPEVMILSPHWDPISCDLWQLGVILFEVLCGIGSFEELMGWGRTDFRSLSQLRVCEEELQVRFAKTAKVNTLAVVGSLCDLATPEFAMELLADMLQLDTTARLPASCMASRLNC